MSVHKFLSISTQATIVGLLLLLPPVESTALEWSASPSVSIGSSVNDNEDLVPPPVSTVWYYSVSPQVTLSVSAPQWMLSGRARINRLEYPNAADRSRTDDALDLTLTRQYEHSQWGINGTLVQDSTLESELLSTGRVTTRAQRYLRTLSPSWTLQIDELNNVSVAYSYQDVTYSNVTSGTLLDYTTKDPSITLSHDLSEKNKVLLTLGYSEYRSQNPITPSTSQIPGTSQFQYNTTSAQVGFSRTFSETLSGSLMAGVNKTDSTIDSLVCAPFFTCQFNIPIESTSNNTSSLFSASFQKAFESSQLNVGLSRSLEPTADGGLLETDRLTGSYNARITPTLSGSLDMSVYKSQPSTGLSNSPDSRYYNISPKIDWQITELWTASTSYSRSVYEQSNNPQATGNAINLTINYNWPKISRSR